MKNAETKRGFTLIELIVVVAILAILAAIAVPSYLGLREQANLAVDDANVASLKIAIAADQTLGTVTVDGKTMTLAKAQQTIFAGSPGALYVTADCSFTKSASGAYQFRGTRANDANFAGDGSYDSSRDHTKGARLMVWIVPDSTEGSGYRFLITSDA